MSDRQNLVSNAAPFGTAVEGDLESGNIQSQTQGENPAQKTILEQSSHPVALVFHYIFKVLAIVFYLLGTILFGNSRVLWFIIIVLLVSFDFWTVKNVTGRLLVGLRWWNEIRDDGTNEWIFESKQNSAVNAVDSYFFWVGLYGGAISWTVLGLSSIFFVSATSVPLCLVGAFMSYANLIGYLKCRNDAKKKLAEYVAGQGFVQNMVGSMISNSLFGSR